MEQIIGRKNLLQMESVKESNSRVEYKMGITF